MFHMQQSKRDGLVGGSQLPAEWMKVGGHPLQATEPHNIKARGTRESLKFSTPRLCSRHAIDYLYLLSGLMAYVYVWSSRCTSICSELDRAECLQQHQQKHRDFMEWKKSELFLRWEERSVEQNG